ncbi:isochorismatase family protein [Acephala macrosclerotiorum]|nr:isochorismatase family protein [Acephala macrosclerotiorum]
MATALLILDVQAGVVPRISALAITYLPHLAQTINAARSAGVKIIYVRTCFRPSHPEISPLNPIFSRFLNSNSLIEGSPEVEIHPALPVLSSDIVVTKKRVSAFSGSGLDVILRAQGVRKLVLTGMATSSAVLATAFEACDRDFEVTVLRDLCVDREEETNMLVLEKVIGKLGRVVDSAGWVEELGGGA